MGSIAGTFMIICWTPVVTILPALFRVPVPYVNRLLAVSPSGLQNQNILCPCERTFRTTICVYILRHFFLKRPPRTRSDFSPSEKSIDRGSILCRRNNVPYRASRIISHSTTCYLTSKKTSLILEHTKISRSPR